MKAKQDTTRQAEARTEAVVTGLGPAITIQSAGVIAKDEFAGHGGSYVFHPAIGMRVRADAEAGAVVEGAQ